MSQNELIECDFGGFVAFSHLEMSLSEIDVLGIYHAISSVTVFRNRFYGIIIWVCRIGFELFSKTSSI